MRRVSSIVLALAVFASACGRPVAPLPPAPARPTPTLPAVAFPRDAQPHDALTEWWYFTGHLSADDGAQYGFEFTIFQVRRKSAPSGYLAHFAVTDVHGQRFSHQARVAQGDARESFPLEVGGWRLDSGGLVDRIDAQMDGATLQLSLRDLKPPALHHGGLIDYGAAGASYYYSRTRLDAQGTLSLDAGPPRAVHGEAWMDHQWGDFVVASLGWDWFSLQLDDRTELMLYVLRDPAGAVSSTYCTSVGADGAVSECGAVATALGTWTSPHTGATYPASWQLALPSGERLAITPLLADQELYFPNFGGTIYWEGAVRVSGDRTGQGYVELTGYAGS